MTPTSSTPSWESAISVNRFTLMFPPPEERQYLREHCASKSARQLLTFIMIFTLVVVTPLYTWSLSETPTENKLQSWIIPLIINLSLSIPGLAYLFLRSEEGYKSDFERFYVPPISLCAAGGMLLTVLCTDNLVLLDDVGVWRLSLLPSYLGFIYYASGIVFRVILTSTFCVVLHLIDLTQDLIVWITYRESTAALRVFGNLVPGVLAHFMFFLRAYHNELSLRAQFSGLKRTQRELLRVQNVEKTIESLLENMLPKRIIPRLMASNFKFSTVTDRFDKSYCIFIDFFHSGAIKTLEAESAAAVLHETFVQFDELLMKFPMIEKVKTISTKCLLTGIVHDGVEHPGSLVVELIQQTFALFEMTPCITVLPGQARRLLRDVRIGIAYGSIVCGIVGEEKFVYDVYSDCVNTSSRMANLPTTKIACTMQAYESFNSETRNKWRSLGILSVKGKGDMSVYELVTTARPSIAQKLSHEQPPKASARRGSLSAVIFANRLKVVSDNISGNRRAVGFESSIEEKANITTSGPLTGQPLGSFATLKYPHENTLPRYSSTTIGTYSESLVVLDRSRTKRSAKSQRVNPVVSSETVDNIINGQQPLDSGSLEEGEAGGLQEIIAELAPVMLTATPDSLGTLLLKYVVPFKLTFKSPFIEARFQRESRQRDDIFVKRHTLVACVMMCSLSVIVVFYEVFLFRQVGIDIENGIRSGTPVDTTERFSDHIGRLAAIGIVIATSIVEVGCAGYQTFESGKSPSSTLSWVLHYLFSASSENNESALTQYFFQIALIMAFTIPLLGWTTYTLTALAPSAIIPLIDILISFTQRPSISVTLRMIVTLVCDIVLCLARIYVVEPITVPGWVTTITSVLVTQFIVNQGEISERVRFLLQETLRSTQAKYDRKAFMSSGLLKAILPARIASKMIHSGGSVDETSIVERFKVITILHLDVVSFTVLSGTLEPQVLITLLDSLFSNFDQICRKRGVEKILTIGDAYVAARFGAINGDDKTPVNEPSKEQQRESADAVCFVGIEMQSAMKLPGTAYEGVQIRVGIHTGPASGFITGGLSKMKYELIGETVDLAEKVQEKAQPGTVFASVNTVSILSEGLFLIKDTDVLVNKRLNVFEINLMENK
ncbi:hypothetical protein HDU76_009655 [Blyttiomyces sp. JEL0837]|nr:hypothetical protein HDU76_009655 [Blyttiomyces sp. JEL0837]